MMESMSWSSEQVGSAIADAAQDFGYSQLTNHQSLMFQLAVGSLSAIRCSLELSIRFERRESIVILVSPLMALMKD